MGIEIDNSVQNTNQMRIPHNYAELYSRFTPEEMTLIVQLKRFFECVNGDRAFCESVETGQFTQEQLDYLRDVGVLFDVEEVSLLWQESEANEVVSHTLNSVVSPDDLPEGIIEKLKRYPLLYLWARFTLLKSNMYRQHNQSIPNAYAHSKSANFFAWRRRRIRATQSELGSYGYNIDHPTLAIELAVGCSVGCYFCAFDAPKLQQVFGYAVSENRELFQGVARSLADVMGPHAAGHALLYWSTEPHDNPNYIDFMKEYEKITGHVVCTSTARFDEEWIRNLITFYRPRAQPWPRVSVLSKKVMQRLHRQFTPDEFRDVNLLMQQTDGEVFRKKVPGGRPKMLKRLEDVKDLRVLEEGQEFENSAPQGSIACVSGFLINLIDKTIKLISPCYTTEQYPYGYRIFDEATFETVNDFNRILHDMVERKMALAPYASMPMRFRDDLLYQPKEDGFDLVSPFQRHHYKGDGVWEVLGELISRGDLTHAQVCEISLDEYQCNPMLVNVMIQNLFHDGVLDELKVNCPTQLAEPEVTPTETAPVTAS
jgi:radical SAM family RiPP maturation amino acid epimerase